MSGVTVTAEGFTVDAALLAAAFAVDQDTLRTRMRSGEITTLCETGVEEDEGRFRLTFRDQARVLRLTVDASGTVVSKVTFPVTARSGM